MKKLVSLFLTASLMTSLSIAPISAMEASAYMQAKGVVNRLEGCENLQKAKITAQEVQLVLENGSQKDKQIIQKLFDSALPVPEPPETPPELDTGAEEVSRYGLRHNTLTDQTEVLDTTALTPEEDGKTVAAEAVPPAPSVTRAAVNSWYEANPSSFDNTRPTCKLFLYTDKGNLYGSGFLMGQTRIGTAAHNIYNPEFADDKWVDSILVVPCYPTASPNAPYGYALSTTLAVPSTWMPNDTANYKQDYGVIHINKAFTFPYFSRLAPGNSINGWWVRAQGYPGSNSNMYLVSGNIQNNADTSFIMYGEQLKGASGGPVLDARYYCIGIISRGGGGRTQAVKFTDGILNNMMSW